MIKIVKRNEKGFTLIELMIVIAIIGILAAIAVPQFMTYRMRAYNSAAKATVHNLKADNANLNSELGVYGHTEAVAALLSDGDVGHAESDCTDDTALVAPATTDAAGARLSGINFAGTREMSLAIALGTNMIADAWDDNDANDTSAVNIFARHFKGDTAYGIDSDIENTLYTVSNPNFPNNAGLQATPIQATLTQDDDIDGIGGNGLPTEEWTKLP